MTPHYRRRVSPFGNLRVTGSLHLTGAVSLLATPFFGSQRQGIHRTPLLAYVVQPCKSESIDEIIRLRSSRLLDGTYPRARYAVFKVRESLTGSTPFEAWRKNSNRPTLLAFLRQTTIVVETTGLEPVTFSVQGRHSPN